MFFLKVREHPVLAVAFITLTLSGCGGGGGDSSSTTSTSSNTIKPQTVNKPETKKQPVKASPQFILKASPNIPAIPNNHPAKFAHSQLGEQALQAGIYKTELISLINDKKNCPSFGKVACPSFERVWMDSNNQIQTDSWAYLPVDKRWVKLRDSLNSLKLFYSDFSSDGSTFSPDYFNPKEVSWTPSASGYQTTYLKNADFKFSIVDRDIAGSSVTTNGTAATYTDGAKALDFEIGLEDGEYYDFEDADAYGDSEDNAAYKTLESYRAAHSSKETFTCAFEEDSNIGLVFNLNKLGVTLYGLEPGSCSKDIDDSEPTKKIKEYVKVIDRKKVLVLPPISLDSVVAEPFYNVITLNDNGIAAHGRYYQKGWAIEKTDYTNEVAMLDWLKTYYNETSALVIPSKSASR